MTKKGFTLVELIVTITIIGILATIILVTFGNSAAKSRDSKRKGDIQAIAGALDMYKADKGTYRASNADSYDMAKWNSLAKKLKQYLEPLPIDPKNNMVASGDQPWFYLPSLNQYAYSVNTFPTCPCAGPTGLVAGHPNDSGYCLTANLETNSGNGSQFVSGTKCGGVYNNVGSKRGDKLFVVERHYYTPDMCPAGSASEICS